MKARRGPILVIFAVLAFPAPCLGATAKVSAVDQVQGEITDSVVEYAAARDERNRLTVVEATNGKLRLNDPAGIEPGAGCVRQQPGDHASVVCDPYPAGLPGISISLSDGDDRASVAGFVEGASVFLNGGTGDDVLTTKLGPDGGPTRFAGGSGDDRFNGGGERDIFLEGARSNGSDTMTGGAGGEDTVSYKRRRRGVRVSLDGRRDDGTRRERDRVGRDVEIVLGGGGHDELRGNGRRNGLLGRGGSDRLSGRGGEDELVGGSGGDRLDGGPSRDHLAAGRGRDRVRARDASTDLVSCGRGRDRIQVDRLDYFGKGCERVRRRGRPVAVILDVTDASIDSPQGSSTAIGTDVGCPRDGPRRCKGSLRIRHGTDVLRRTRFKLRRGRELTLETEVAPSFPPEGEILVTVRSRDARHRLRTVTLRARPFVPCRAVCSFSD